MFAEKYGRLVMQAMEQLKGSLHAFVEYWTGEDLLIRRDQIGFNLM